MARAARRLLVIRSSFGDETEVRYLPDVLLEPGFETMRAYFSIFSRTEVEAFLAEEGFSVSWVEDRRQRERFGGEPEVVGRDPAPVRVPRSGACVSLRVAVVGLGSIGRRHLENLQVLGCEAIAVRRSPGSGELGSLEEAASWGADAVVIATPTAEHAGALRWAVESGMHAYVEKPLAERSDGLDELLERAEREGLVVATGYNLRFHPALEAVREAVLERRIGALVNVRAEVGQYLPDWHPGEDIRASYAARADLGGGALLTLSHELDYVRWIAGEIVDVRRTGRPALGLVVDVDDVAEIVCLHESGTLGSVTCRFPRSLVQPPLALGRRGSDDRVGMGRSGSPAS